MNYNIIPSHKMWINVSITSSIDIVLGSHCYYLYFTYVANTPKKRNPFKANHFK